MSFVVWFLCVLFGMFLFMVLYGLASIGIMAIPIPWAQLPACILAGSLGLFLYAIWTNMTEHRPITELYLKSMWKDLGRGLLLGVVYFGAVVGVMALLDGFSITGAKFNWFPQLSSFLFFFVVAVFEEIVFRGVLFRMIDDRWNTAAALIVSSLAFGALHMFNTGATIWSSVAIAIEAGLLLGAAYKCSGTLWLPIGIHWAWNYVQGNVLGFAVSGSQVNDKIFSSIIVGPDWLTGGIFGAEASVPAVGVGLLLSIILLANTKRDRR